jgi:hypothetical protein
MFSYIHPLFYFSGYSSVFFYITNFIGSYLILFVITIIINDDDNDYNH